MMIYTGAGKFYPGIPARNLNDREVEIYGGEKFLERLGIYAKPKKEKPKKDDQEVEEGE